MNRALRQFGWSLVCGALGVMVCRAASIEWKTADTSGDWHTGGNWVGDVAPGASDSGDFTGALGSVDVTFTNDVTSGFYVIGGNQVRLDFQANTFLYQSATRPSLYVEGSGTVVTLTNGLLSYETAAGYAYIQNSARLTVDRDAIFNFQGTHLQVAAGMAGQTASVLVQNGGALLVNTAAGTYSFNIGATAGAGEVTVTGAGSVFSNLTTAAYFRMGTTAGITGTLNVADGGRFVNRNTQASDIGRNGVGIVGVTGGGIFDNTQGGILNIGKYSGSLGSVVVSGSESRFLQGAANIFVGGDSSSGAFGSMLLTDGAQYQQSGGQFYAGYLGSGLVTISNGASLVFTAGQGGTYVRASAAGATSELRATGTNSYARVGDLFVGLRNNGSTGVLTVANGAAVEYFRGVHIGVANAGQTQVGTVLITGEGSALRPYAGSTNGLDATFRNIGVGGYNYYSGDSIWTADGLTTNAYERGEGRMVIEKGGTVESSNGLLVFSNSTLRIDGGTAQAVRFGMETGSVFQAVLNLSDANAAGLVIASGEVRLWGASLDVQLADGYTPSEDDVFKLIDGSVFDSQVINRFSRNGSILEDESTFSVGSTEFKIEYFGGDVLLTVIPEPGTLGLIGIGTVFAAWARRRRHSVKS
ncbi:MAG: PEP-CTERM sorting domain-containing protein [Kiritimatiellia bacterium]|nr:PEP-CTERM sorting domain-containing protein [Kiritimatiellia bacterium]